VISLSQFHSTLTPLRVKVPKENLLKWDIVNWHLALPLLKEEYAQERPQTRLQNSPGSRVLRAAMAADMGSVLKLGNSLKSSSHRLDISIEDYPPSLRQHHRVMSTIPTPRERKLADTPSLAVWDISSDPVRYQINTCVSRRITPPPPTPPRSD
jgi:hypothetical protein